MLRTLAMIVLLATGLACTGDSKKQQEMNQGSANAPNAKADNQTNTPDTRTTGQPNGTANTGTSSNNANVPQPGPAQTPTPQASSNTSTTRHATPRKK